MVIVCQKLLCEGRLGTQALVGTIFHLLVAQCITVSSVLNIEFGEMVYSVKY